MALPNAKRKIIEHYDVVSPYYYKLWDEHLPRGVNEALRTDLGFVSGNYR